MADFRVETTSEVSMPLESIQGLLQSAGFEVINYNLQANSVNIADSFIGWCEAARLNSEELLHAVTSSYLSARELSAAPESLVDPLSERVYGLQNTNGEQSWIKVHFQEQRDNISMLCQNITGEHRELQRGQKALWALEQIDKMMTNSYIAIAEVEPPNRIIYSGSDHIAKLWGGRDEIAAQSRENEPAEVALQNLAQLIEPEDREIFTKMAATPERADITVRIRHEKSGIRHINIKKDITYDVDGSPQYIIGYMTDITDAMVAQQEVNGMQEWYKGFISQLPDEIYQIRRDGSIVSSNTRDQSIFRSLSVNDLATIIGHIKTVCTTGEASEDDITTSASGEHKYLNLRFVPTPDNENDQSALLMIRDLTLLKRTHEEQLQREIRWAMQCMATVAHDMKNHLAVISSSSYLVRMQMPLELRESPKMLNHLEKIAKKIKILTEMVEIHEYLGRTHNSGKFEIAREPMELVDLLSELIDDNEELLEGRELHVDFPEGGIELYGDDKLLKHAFTNVISNAAKYSKPGSEVVVRVEKDTSANEARIVIQDHGQGMNQNEVANLFRPFYRGETAIQSQIPGTGLGLHITQMCVAAHNGRITAESEIGVGTTFTIALPLTMPSKNL